MKKFTWFVIFILLGLTGFEYYQRFEPKLAQITENLKSGTAVDNIKAEIFAPGGLRAKIESTNASLTSEGVVEQTNDRRHLQGVPALKNNQLLAEAALAKVKDMFAGQYFEHISPIGKGPADLAKAVGYTYVAVGENLALGNYKDDSALVEAWMNSPGHRANILNVKFTEIGVAVMKGTFEGKTTWLAVQEFGRPASDCPKVDQFLKSQIDQGKLEVDRLEQEVQAAKQQLETWPEPKGREEVDAYNQKVADYNNLVKVFNNRIDTQKQLVSQYNQQVKAFNECLAR